MNVSTGFDDWAEIYDPIHSTRIADVQFYVDTAKSAGDPILELSVGTGRIGIPIAKAGSDVIGLDISSSMLSIARRNLKAAGKLAGNLTLKRGDMRNFHLAERFNLIIIPFNSFLNLLNISDQRRALQCIHQHLRPGGQLVLDIFVPNLERLVREDAQLYNVSDVTDPTSGRRFVIWEQTSYDNHDQILYSRYIIEELDGTGKLVQSLHRSSQMRYIHRFEMQHLLEVQNFQVDNLYGDFHYTDFDVDSNQMVWVARRI